MTLRRQLSTSSNADVTVQGYLALFAPDQVGSGDIMQGDGNVAILNDEIVAAGWPGPPRARDVLIIDGRNWTVRGSTPLWEGANCIGHNIYIRGG